MEHASCMHWDICIEYMNLAKKEQKLLRSWKCLITYLKIIIGRTLILCCWWCSGSKWIEYREELGLKAKEGSEWVSEILWNTIWGEWVGCEREGFMCLNRRRVEEMELGTGLKDNYQTAPWPSLKLVFEHERLKGKQGQMLEKGSDFVGLLPKCSFLTDKHFGKVTKDFSFLLPLKTNSSNSCYS